ncbi:MAG: hypothetical protein AMXMBFR13_06790 [Phycisphaerae bacterium]
MFELRVAFWPHAIVAGLRPVKTDGFEEGEQYYHEHDFLFEHPPDRADWWELCRQTPWMFCFEKYRPIIESHPWPLVLPGKKAGHVDLLDAQGRRIGFIAVNRRHVMRNPYHMVPDIGSDIWARIVRGLNGKESLDAKSWIMCNEHYIAEEAMREARGQGVTDALLVKIGKRLLRERGQQEQAKLQRTT